MVELQSFVGQVYKQLTINDIKIYPMVYYKERMTLMVQKSSLD